MQLYCSLALDVRDLALIPIPLTHPLLMLFTLYFSKRTISNKVLNKSVLTQT